jgi:K(+)-stimulated pyrophosphate-energized sodium pump
MTALLLIIAAGALSIVYGVYTIQSVMAADAGSQRMQEIASAIREGAQAYLRRQYSTIGVVGIVLFVALAWYLGSRWPSVSRSVRFFRPRPASLA